MQCITLFFVLFTVNDTFIKSVMQECPYSCIFVFWGRYVRLLADMPASIEWFTRVYSRFIAPVQCNADITCCIVRHSSLHMGAFLLADRLLYNLPDSDNYVECAELIIFHHLFNQVDDYLVLHAGVVTRQDRAIVLYGQSGFGKTTLTLELVKRGCGFMSDEFCPIRLSDYMIEPFERLVGLRESNHFYNSIDLQHCMHQSRDGKAFFNCADIFPYIPPHHCQPGVFVEICGIIDRDICPPHGVVLDIQTCSECSSVIDTLRKLSGVTLSDPIIRGSYPLYRVTASDRQSFMTGFNRIWAQNPNDIISVFPYKGEINDYDRVPELHALSSFEAINSLLSNIVNRAPTGRLLKSYGRKTSSLVMLLGGVLKNTQCYRLQPGQLAMTADIIDNL